MMVPDDRQNIPKRSQFFADLLTLDGVGAVICASDRGRLTIRQVVGDCHDQVGKCGHMGTEGARDPKQRRAGLFRTN